MKKIFFVFFIVSKVAAGQFYAPGFDFALFDNTPGQDLARAVEKQDTQKIFQLVRVEKANINYREAKFDQSLLTLALFNGKYNSVAKLLELGADPNLVSTHENCTPFLSACEYFNHNSNMADILRLLIQYGANVNYVQFEKIKQPSGSEVVLKRTALIYLCNYGTLDCVKLLIENGAKLDIYPKDGEHSIIYEASLNARFDILDYLLIEKKVPIPEYCVIQLPGTKKERKITLREIVENWKRLMDNHQKKLQSEILQFLKQNGK